MCKTSALPSELTSYFYINKKNLFFYFCYLYDLIFFLLYFPLLHSRAIGEAGEAGEAGVRAAHFVVYKKIYIYVLVGWRKLCLLRIRLS